MPLFRLGGEKVIRKDLGLDYTAPEMFAGSIFDLEPDTEYEARFEMRDPDGVRGKRSTPRRRAPGGEPKPRADGRRCMSIRRAGKARNRSPRFTGLKEAYFGSGHGDWAWSANARCGPAT